MMPDPDAMAQFRWRLAETIAWCRPRLSLTDIADSLRTPALCPEGYLYSYRAKPYSYTYMEPELGVQPVSGWQAAVESVVEQRAQLLRNKQHYPQVAAENLAGGRLLFYDPSANMGEGPEQVETPFFDVNAVPAWDTWFDCVESQTQYRGSQRLWYAQYIISWVPPELIEQVDRGLRTSTTEAVQWADLFNSPLLQQLRAVGLISE